MTVYTLISLKSILLCKQSQTNCKYSLYQLINIACKVVWRTIFKCQAYVLQLKFNKNRMYHVCYIFYYLFRFTLKKRMLMAKWVIGSISCIKDHVIFSKYLKYTISATISNQDFAEQRNKITELYNNLS